jgi:hypothetical protein
MATILLPRDFKEFLRLLNPHGVEYLVVGGYAVNYHGYPRATGDLNAWETRRSALRSLHLSPELSSPIACAVVW